MTTTSIAPAAAPLPTPAPPPSFEEGQKVAGCYLLRRRFEVPGEDVIWMAYDEVLEKEVSLHFLPPQVRSDALRQEIKRNRQLIHPHILRIYDLVEEKEWAAIVMDCFDGDSLASILQRKGGGFFEPAQIKPWLASLCQTLEDAHKIHLVHRDLSPANIFVEKSGKLLVAKFGISRLVRDALNRLRGPAANEPGLAYLSPQQLDGERPSAGDDIYAFGALIYELLTGQPPFSGKEMVQQIRRKVPPSIGDRRIELKKAGAVVPPAWEKAIAACLEKSAEQRPKSISNVASQLGAEPITTQGAPATVFERPSAAAISKTAAPVAPIVAETPVARPTAKPETRVPERLFKPVPEPKTAPLSFVPLKSTPFAEAKAESTLRTRLEGAAQSEIKTKSQPNVHVEALRKAELELAALQKAVPDHYPSFEPRRMNFPLTWLAAAAILIMFGVYGLFFYSPARVDAGAITAPGGDPVPSAELTRVTNPGEATGQGEDPSGIDAISTDVGPLVAAAPSEENPKPPLEPAQNNVTEPGPASVLPAASKSAPAVAERNETPATASPAPTASSTPVPGDSTVTAKTAALEKARQEAEAADKAHKEMLKQKEQAEAALAQAQKALEEKTKAAAPMLKAAEEATAQRKTREEEMRAAEAAAQQAQQLAAEKARMAEEAKKAFTNVEKENKEKLAAQQKAESELKELQSSLEEKRRQAGDVAKAVADANARREEQAAAVKRTEQELADARMVAQKAAEKRRTIEVQIAEARAMFEKRIAELENSLKSSEGTPGVAPPNPIAPKGSSAPPPVKPDVATPSEAPVVPPAANPAAAKAPSAETLLALKTETGKPTAEARKGLGAQHGFENSLGMKFASVGNVLFGVWQTRVKDFEAFARTTGLRSTTWRDPGFRQGPDHPVVNVSWREAIAFCKWLTAKEQKEGLLAPGQEYRLPTDLEWSKAVGLPEESGKTPEARDMGVPNVYPWGTAWPPPKGAGNYTGEETGSDVAIKGYDDGFAWTSPVGSFAPNKYGLYDMGGNVWQWCMDSWNAEQKTKVVRGASWYNGALKLSLLSSCRIQAAPDSSTDNYGFRCVIAPVESGKTPRR